MTDHMEEKLTRILYRRFCPDSTVLGEYESGLLPLEQVAQVREHLSGCPHCRRELVILGNFLRDVNRDLEPGIAGRIKTWIAERVPDFKGGNLTLTPAWSMRGESELPLFYQAGEAELTLEIQEDARHTGRKAVLGLLTGIDPEGVEALLWLEREQVAGVEVSEIGNFMLEDLAPGKYSLVLSGPDVEILVPDLEI